MNPDVDNSRSDHRDGPTLLAEGLSKSYDNNLVLSDVSLAVNPGEVLAVVGENGAGKSTLSGIIAGLTQPDAGRMFVAGKPYAPASPGAALQAGIALIHQELRLLPDLSVAENIFVGRLLQRNGFVDRETMNRTAQEQLHRLGLDLDPNRPVRQLRVAAQQLVEIAKALTRNARLLILDEPTAALGSEETDRLFVQVNQLRRQGVSFIYISHRLEEIARISDRIAVLRDGRLVAKYPTAQVPVRSVLENMVGRSVDRIFPKIDAPAGSAILEVNGLTSPQGAFREVSFTVRQGEVFGIAGLVGAGRTELVRAVAGVDPILTGTVSVAGEKLPASDPSAAIRAGLVLVPEDRKAQGLLLDQTVAHNLALGNFDLLRKNGWIPPARVRDFARKAIDRLGVKGTPAQLVRYLSGGNQQKVVIARWISRTPKVFILDEPTRGIDMGARAAIYETIASLARAGMGVVVVSSELEEVMGLSHRVLVLSRGREKGVLEASQATQVAVMELATA
ncbi:MAG: sugar ABC transporter ATP-binding protein [Verrucomicrobia bacterium]|nr:sugar ABC transporter ATP-binding protein [Verrucomicrobiota bacterium]